MKKLILLLFVFLELVHSSNAQTENQYLNSQLEKFKKSKDKLVSIGFSASELKAKIGNPKAIESGIISTDAVFINESPKMVEQNNYSTWFYFFNPIEMMIPDSIFILNGRLTSNEIYNSYFRKDVLYLVEDKLVSFTIGENYRLTNSKKLRLEAINSNQSKIIPGGNKEKMIPIYCAIFDKGTQVVASTSAFFIL